MGKDIDLKRVTGGVVQAGMKSLARPIIAQTTAYFALDVSDETIGISAWSDNDFVYSDNGSTSSDAVVFTGSGLNDATGGGTYSGTTTVEYKVVVDATGTPDTFEWFKNGVSQASGVSITGAAQNLDDGITVTFAATTGHTLNDQWIIQARANAVTASLLNLDLVNQNTVYFKGTVANQEIYILKNMGV